MLQKMWLNWTLANNKLEQNSGSMYSLPRKLPISITIYCNSFLNHSTIVGPTLSYRSGTRAEGVDGVASYPPCKLNPCLSKITMLPSQLSFVVAISYSIMHSIMNTFQYVWGLLSRVPQSLIARILSGHFTLFSFKA